jgi:hypothetical protein
MMNKLNQEAKWEEEWEEVQAARQTELPDLEKV